jgi:23S rRNA (uridine2479-2'-O)-methyltransferase
VTNRRITSANDDFQLALSLRANRKQRRRQRRFIVEDVRSLNAAIEHGWPIDSFWYSGERRLSSWARSLLDSGVAARRFELSQQLMDELSDRDDSSELIALAELPPHDLTRIALTADRARVVAFDRPVLPGNLGSVIRSADALGAAGVLVTGHGVDVYDPQTVRAATGALFTVPVVHAASLGAVERWLEAARAVTPGLRVIGTSAHAAVPLVEANLAGPTLLVLGNETRGLGAGWRSLCDEVVLIPMREGANSLNVAAAAAILLYEADRQRREQGHNR